MATDGSAEQPRDALPTLLHSPTRLAILGTLRRVQHVSFADVRDALHLTTPELSRQVAILEEEGIVEVAKLRQNRKVVTQLRLSDTGRERFNAYLARLRAIVGDD
ncbi:transcriptional regulator [Streptomyces sp. NPDC001941]|uniref:transcriptional regulator n=1 Tax=Streptomyces sp. NPDC001941 TaxID=3154659 RepID=UPI0033174EB0